MGNGIDCMNTGSSMITRAEPVMANVLNRLQALRDDLLGHLERAESLGNRFFGVMPAAPVDGADRATPRADGAHAAVDSLISEVFSISERLRQVMARLQDIA